MPIDPRIPLGVNPGPQFDPWAAAQRGAQMRNLPALSRMRDLQLANEEMDFEARRQEVADESTTRSVLNSTPDLGQALPKLPYKQRIAMQKLWQEQRKADLDEEIKVTELETKQYEQQSKRLEFFGRKSQELLALKDPDAFAQGYVDTITEGLSQGLFGQTREEANQFIAQMPSSGDDPQLYPMLQQLVEQLNSKQAGGMTPNEYATRQHQDAAFKQATLEKERDWQAGLPKRASEQLAIATQFLGSATSDSQYQLGLSSLKRVGVSGEVLAQLPPRFDQGTPTYINALGQTSAQRVATKATSERDVATERYRNERLTIAKGQAGVDLNPKQQTVFNQIVGQYNKSPLITGAEKATVFKGIVRDASTNLGDPTKQLAVIYAFVKILDNYESAVREGEIGLVREALGLRQKLDVAIGRINEGKIVDNETMKLYIATGSAIATSLTSSAQRKDLQYEAQAKANGDQVYNAWKSYKSNFSSMLDDDSEIPENPYRQRKK